ncbi:hypothetical protein GCM10019996_03710 [Lentilactobacillus parakefiri]
MGEYHADQPGENIGGVILPCNGSNRVAGLKYPAVIQCQSKQGCDPVAHPHGNCGVGWVKQEQVDDVSENGVDQPGNPKFK